MCILRSKLSNVLLMTSMMILDVNSCQKEIIFPPTKYEIMNDKSGH